MDSCNSTGSMESSSGGDDDEYTLRPPAAAAAPTATIFPFLMNNTSGLLPFLRNHDHNPPLPVFEVLPYSFDQIVRPGWTDRHNHHHQSQLFQLGAAVSGDELSVMLPPPALQVPANLGYRPGQSNPSVGLTGGLPNLAVPPVSDPPKLLDERPEMRNNNSVPPARRNPKKRSRASRRAPTTVLTTDSSNFLAMVQEFTGIPSPRFAAATSPFQQARLDLFGTNFTSSATALGLSQPFAQRLFQAASPPTTLFVPATTSGNNTAISTSTELFFPLLSNHDNNSIDSAPTAPQPRQRRCRPCSTFDKYSQSTHPVTTANEPNKNNINVLGETSNNKEVREEFIRSELTRRSRPRP